MCNNLKWLSWKQLGWWNRCIRMRICKVLKNCNTAQKIQQWLDVAVDWPGWFVGVWPYMDELKSIISFVVAQQNNCIPTWKNMFKSLCLSMMSNLFSPRATWQLWLPAEGQLTAGLHKCHHSLTLKSNHRQNKKAHTLLFYQSLQLTRSASASQAHINKALQVNYILGLHYITDLILSLLLYFIFNPTYCRLCSGI